jgi:hypothetical protein
MFLQVRISHVLRFISIVTYLLTLSRTQSRFDFVLLCHLVIFFHVNSMEPGPL